jgi:MGT family glycosyltransferase
VGVSGLPRDLPILIGARLATVFLLVARIALVNAPFQSHVAAMLRLGDVLARQGHELTVWAPEQWRAQVERLGGRFEPSVHEIPRLPPVPLAAALASITEREAERLIPRLLTHDVDVLIRDSQTPWALVAGQYLGIPRIVSHPMFPMLGQVAADDSPGDPSLQPAEKTQPAQADRRRFERSWLSIARRWGVQLTDVSGLYHRTSEPTLTFTTEEILGPRKLPPAWRCIGPLLPPPPPRGPEERPPLVYASFGTAQNRRTELFRIAINALAGQPVRLLISTAGRSLTPEELGPVPPNITVREFVPAREVLARATVHITHGGANSVHESLVAGVPLVCLPQAFDQIPLSERIAEIGAGVIVEEDACALLRAVLGLLGDDRIRERTRAIAESLQRFDGEAHVAAAIAGWT